MSALDLVRPDLRKFAPYRAAAPVYDATRLHANEATWRQPWDDTVAGLNRYPDPVNARLAARLADLYGVEPENVLLARGSDDAIDALTRLTCAGGKDAVAICPPTFGMYAVAARVQGADVIEVPLTAPDYAIDVATLVRDAAGARLVYLCSPNNPTGNVYSLDVVRELCAAFAGRAIVVMDEAYLEFARTPSAATLLGEFDNLAVLRTLSKAYALAGARVGTLLARPELIGLARAILPPYPLPAPSLEAAERAVAPAAVDAMERQIDGVIARRETLAERLRELPAVRTLWPSAGNFLLIRVDDAPGVEARCRAAGLLVRRFDAPDVLRDCVRITVGSESANATLLSVIEEIET